MASTKRRGTQFDALHASSYESFEIQADSLCFRHFDGWMSRDLERLVDDCDWRIERVAKWDNVERISDSAKLDSSTNPNVQ